MYAPIAGQSSDGVDVALDSEANRRLGGGIRCRQQQRSLCDWSSPGLLHHQVPEPLEFGWRRLSA